MKKHLVGSQILSDDIIGVGRNYGQAYKQMKIVRQIICPASFPDPNGDGFCEFSFEASAKEIFEIFL